MQMHRYYRRCIIVCTLAVTFFLLITLVTAAPDAVLLQKSKDSKEAIIKDLEKLVNIDTGTGYEEGLKKFQGILIERLKAMGAKVEATEVEKPVAGYNIIATFTGTGQGYCSWPMLTQSGALVKQPSGLSVLWVIKPLARVFRMIRAVWSWFCMHCS